MDQMQRMEEIYNKCKNELASFEIWEGYYRMRFEEFKGFYALFPEKHFEYTLEIGCGIGYQSAFLSCISNEVVASDIDIGNMVKHSRGLGITREFIRRAGISNVSVEHANAEALPFSSDRFDFIYSSYSFQYIPDKSKALAEINRVLQPGGYFFCVLPTTGNRLRAAGRYYSALLKRIPHLLLQKKNQTSSGSGIAHQPVKKNSIWSKLLPPPDDESSSFFKELADYSASSWSRLFESNGHKIVAAKPSNYENRKKGFLGRWRSRHKAEGFILITQKNEYADQKIVG